MLADNRTVCTVSVIHSQIKEPEKVISVLAQELEMKEEDIRKRVEKVSSIERIKQMWRRRQETPFGSTVFPV